jgi:hypothetical protein
MCGRYNTNKNFPRLYMWREHNERVTARNMFELLRRLGSLREAYGGDLQPGWQDRVCNKICDDPKMKHLCSDTGDTERQITNADVLRFLATVTKWAASGGSIVDSETSERRAAICADCPENVPVRGCMGCSSAIPKIMTLMKGAITTRDDELQGCNVCGCQLRAKVHLPRDVMVDGDNTFPDHCWLNE